MDTNRIERRVGVRASADRLWELISDFGSWSRWNPYEVEVSGAIAFGGKINLTERLPDMPERAVQAAVGEWQPRAQLVLHEKRGLWFNSIRYFEIEELEPNACIVANGAIFSGLRGELFHDKHRRSIRRAYEEIGENLRKVAEEG